MACGHLLAPPQYPRLKKEYFTAICPLQPIFTAWDDSQGSMYPAGGQLLGRSVVTKSFTGGKCVQPGITVEAFIGAALVALEGLVLCFSCSFLCFHVACH